VSTVAEILARRRHEILRILARMPPPGEWGEADGHPVLVDRLEAVRPRSWLVQKLTFSARDAFARSQWINCPMCGHEFRWPENHTHSFD